MKILYVTTIAGSMVFFPELFKSLLAYGHTIELACNCTNPIRKDITAMKMEVHDIPFSRSPLSHNNIEAYKKLKKVVNEGNFDLVHCHTPIAAMITRLVCRKFRKKGLKVFYTAHGFHFYKNAPLKNWLFYYPVEKMCSRWTDVLITINKEDYAFAQKKMKAKRVEYVPGVGIDLEKFGTITIDRNAKREELGIPAEATLLLSVGELNQNKNHETVIRAISGMDVYYIIAGQGDLKAHLVKVAAEVGMADRVKLLGYRADVNELYAVADLFVFPSFREGLSVSLMEAMASGLPVICGRIRGNVDLIENEMGGYLCKPDDINAYVKAIAKLSKDLNLRITMSCENSKTITQFDIVRINGIMMKIYCSEI